jgi:lysozyme family protein
MLPIIPEDAKPTVLKSNIPIVTFFARTWMLFLFMLASNYAVLNQHEFGQVIEYTKAGTRVLVAPGHTLFEMLGAVLYVPALASVVMWVYLLMIHLFFRDTLDKDAHNGVYIADWRALNSADRMWMNVVLRVGFFIGFCILCASMAKGAVGSVPDQEARWQAARINPHYSIALDLDVALFKRNAARYQAITDLRANGVPASVLFCLHQRESSGNFRCHPHEGSPLTGRTRFVPKGRLPKVPPPYTFEQSAEDAYYVVDRLDLVNWKSVQEALQGIESFNGLGYQKYHPTVPSPYVYNGLLINGKATRGKYTGDGKFDRTAVDQQLGCAAILLRMQEQGIKTPW